MYCPEAFEDEHDLRFHLYRDHPREELGRIDEKRVKRSFESLVQDDIATLEEHLATDLTPKTAVAAIEIFERVLEKTLEWKGLDQVHNRYVEDEVVLVEALDIAVQTSNREILLDLIDQYHPPAEIAVPPGVGIILGNVIGRDIIRTQVNQGVEAIPAAELEYLETLAEYEHPDETPADRRFEHDRWAVSHAYGWGIGHPSHDIAGYIVETARDASLAEWSEQTLIQAFYADPDAATDTLEQILADDQTHRKRFFVLSLKNIKFDVNIHTPGWDWRAELDVDVELEPEVIGRLRDLIAEHNFSNEISEDWPVTAEDEEDR